MITGYVTDLQARLEINVVLPGGDIRAVEFVVDTGFEGALTMPVDLVSELGLPFFQELSASLADNTSIRTDVYQATVELDGIQADVGVLALGARPLLGTALLAGRTLCAEFIERGRLTITDCP